MRSAKEGSRSAKSGRSEVGFGIVSTSAMGIHEQILDSEDVHRSDRTSLRECLMMLVV
jgi:hypothetical protein